MLFKCFSFLSTLLLSRVYGNKITDIDTLDHLNIKNYQIDKNTEVNYFILLEGVQDGAGYKFSTAYENSPFITNTFPNITSCLDNCAFDNNCLGVYHNWDESNEMCYGLSDLGYTISTDEYGHSIQKVLHSKFTRLDNHSITGIVYQSKYYGENENSTVYIDYNHNGELDIGEPSLNVGPIEEFKFENLTEGNYLVRVIPPDGCFQLYPGLRSEFSTITGDGYVDNVQSYYHHGHSKFIAPHGGYVDSSLVYENSNFSYVLGNDSSTYLSFYPEYNITFIWIDETIKNINKTQNDILIELYQQGETSTQAHVSVSHDGLEYSYLGILNSSNYNFNLNDINYTLPVAYIRLHFFGSNLQEPLNIIRIKGSHYSLWSPEYGYEVSIPEYNDIWFFNDCEYFFSCYTHCFYGTTNYDQDESCLVGCDIFNDFRNCYCERYPNGAGMEEIAFYGNTFLEDYCDLGCNYNFKAYLYPNYQLIKNTEGISGERINLFEECGVNCLEDMISECNSLDNCSSLSLNKGNKGETYLNPKYKRSDRSDFIIKQSMIKDMFQITTTVTTSTSTSSSTSTSTSSSTSTSTSSSTSTSTSSSTSTSTSSSSSSSSVTTETTTETTSQTTSHTSTPTTSYTSTPTTYYTSTKTTSPTTTRTKRSYISSNKATFTNENPTITTQNTKLDLTPTKSTESTESKTNNYNNLLIPILVLIVILFIALGLVLMGFVIYKKKKNNKKLRSGDDPIAFTNPVYRGRIENENIDGTDETFGENPQLYQDTIPVSKHYHPTDEYIECLPDNNGDDV